MSVYTMLDVTLYVIRSLGEETAEEGMRKPRGCSLECHVTGFLTW